MKRIIFLLIFVFAISFNMTFAQEPPVKKQGEKIGSYEKGIIREVINEKINQGKGVEVTVQNMKIEINSGEDAGKTVEVKNTISQYAPINFEFEVGDRVVLYKNTQGINKGQYFVADHYRQDKVLYIIIGFVISIILVGRLQGIKALLTLGISVAIIFFVFIPLVLKGFSPLLLATISSLLITGITIFVVSGFGVKSRAAILGTLAGVVIAGILSYLVGSMSHLTGLGNEEALMIKFLPIESKLSPEGILYAGIIFGALGAIMDVTMSIASSIEEVHRGNPMMSHRELYKSGMNVGRDVMSTMTNTLILAYIGTAIPLLLIFHTYSHQWVKFINLDMVVTEILRAIAGSIGLILAIPITAFIAAFSKRKIKE